MSAFNKLYLLKPTGEYEGGCIAIYCETREEFEEFLKEELHDEYVRRDYPSVYLDKSEQGYTLMNADKNSNDKYASFYYWEIVQEVPAILPETEFGVIFHDFHDG